MVRTFRLSHMVHVGLRGIAAHRLRSALTALGIVLGVASVIVMLAVGEAARYQALKQLEDLGANTIILKSIKPTGEAQEKKGTDLFAYGLTYADLDRVRETIPTVSSATPMREFRKSIWNLDRRAEVRLVSITPDFLRQNNIVLLRGRGIEAQDEAEFAKVAVIGTSAADSLFPGAEAIGKTVSFEATGNQIPFTVIGITEDKTLAAGTPGENAEFSNVLFIPFQTDRVCIGREIISFKQGISVERFDMSQITVTVRDTAQVTRTANAIRSLLDEFHKEQKDVQMVVPLELLRRAEETQRIFTLILGAIAGISLVVGGIGIMNIMLASVTERTREIGVRRALGAKRRDIAGQFLVETLVLSCGGGILGVLFGCGLALLLRNFLNLPTIISLWSLPVSFGVSVLVGLLSGVYPARRAARLDPIEALRHS